MNLNNNDYVIRLLLLIETLVFLFACVVLFILLPNRLWTVIFVADIGAVLVIYTFVRYRQRRKLKIYINNMITNLNTITNEYDEKLMLIIEDRQMEEYYDKVQEIRGNFKNKEFNRRKILNIVNSVAANMEIEKLLEDLMPKLIEVTESNCGAFYLANNATNKLEIKHSLGFSKNIYAEFDLVLGEGFIGNAAITKEIKIIKDLPEDSIYVMRTFLGKIKPKSMMVVPIVNQDQLLGVFTFASIYEYSDMQLEIVNLIKYYVGAAVGNGLTFEKTKRLTNELKFQNRLIQNLNDDLEKKVQERTNFLNEIMDSITDYAIYTTDRDGIIMVWNKGAENLFGIQAKDIVGKHVKYIYPEDEVNDGLVQKRAEIAIRDGEYTEERWLHKKDGTKCYIQKHLFARYDENHEIIGFTNLSKDITITKNIERSLLFEKALSEKLVKDSANALILTDEFGVINNLNMKSTEILSQDLIMGKEIYKFFENGAKLKENIRNIVDNEIEGDWTFKLLGKEEHINIKASVLVNEIDDSRMVFFRVLF